MEPKSAVKLAALCLILVTLLVTGAGLSPVSVQAQDGSSTRNASQSAQAAPFDPAAGTTGGPAAPADVLASYPSAAAYDSGWIAILPNQTYLLTHNLGGSVDDYVVDLRFYGENPTLGNHGFNQIGYGGNQLADPPPTGYAVDDQVGAFWHSLNTSTVKVYRMPQDKAYATKIRLRIWVAATEDYDSGWLAIAADSLITRTFSIAGGAADNYLVNLEFKDTGAGLGIHQRFYGGTSLAGTNNRVGAYWRNLTDTSIQVYRKAEEDYVDQVRVRIWNQPKPTYDSGWVNGNLGAYVYLTHNIGGNPDDYIVDLQFKDPDNGMGVNQDCYGGCDLRAKDTIYADTKQGAYWRNLTSAKIEVGRRAEDHFADQVRVRIWNVWTPTRPAYDSGWKTTSTGSISQPYHNLGGDEDDYLVNLTYSDTTWGVNQMYYGMKYFGATPPGGYSANQSAGAYWRSLTTSSVVIYRATNDQTVDQWRLRIWRMPKPDYDSGWTPIAAGGVEVFNHRLTGDRSDFLVDVSFYDPDNGSGKNQRYLGGMVTSADDYHGAFWSSFTTISSNSNLSVYRFPDDVAVDQVRVRIWRVNTPDYGSGFQSFTPDQIRTFSHNLGGDADLMLVDVTARQDTGDHKLFYGRVDIGAGDPFGAYVENDRGGFYWYGLTRSVIKAQRLPEDVNALSINARIWSLPAMIYVPFVKK